VNVRSASQSSALHGHTASFPPGILLAQNEQVREGTLCDPDGMRPRDHFMAVAELRRPNFPSHAIADCGLR